MDIFKGLLVVYFLVSLRGLAEEVRDGTQSSQTYQQIAVALSVIVVCVADLIL